MKATQNNSALVRLRAAAAVLGLTPHHLASGVLDGTVPLKAVRIGETTFFRAAELNAWMRGEVKPCAESYDLF